MIEYLSENLWQLWSAVAVLCLILELSSGDFFIACFAVGAVSSAIGAAVGAGIYVQIILFVVFTLLSIFTVRPVALRFLHRGEDRRVSNADALIGRKGRVTQAIEAGGFGRVAIDGDEWKAQSDTGDAIAVGTFVRVIALESIVITVHQIDN